MAVIQVQDLSVVYWLARTATNLVALDTISLDVEDGEFLTIVGPSGCGKTTLINTIAGLVEPTGGAILVDGKPVSGPGPDRAMVFQEYAIFPWRTVWDNVRFGLENQPHLAANAKASIGEAVELVGLSGFEGAYPRELSGGMQQRVGLARALVAQPRILLMDEPFGAIDAMTRDVMRSEIEQIIIETGKTVLFITHSVDEAVELGDRVVVFTGRPGRIRQILPIDVERPRKRRDVAVQQRLTAYKDEIWGSLEEEAANIRGTRQTTESK